MADDSNGTAARDDAAPVDGVPRKRWRTRGGLVTVATVLSLVTAMGATLFGLGAAEHAVASYDAASWLWSRAKGEVARVNGVTGRVDTRLEIPRGQGHNMQVSQTDRFLMLRDLNTGQISSLDLATLQITGTRPTTSGLGVSVALHGDAAFVIDAVQGVVTQLDPRSLAPIGEPIHYPPGIAGGTFDGAGRLWIAVPGEGTLSAITAAPLPSAGTTRTAVAGNPRRVRTVAVAAPSHDLAVSTLDKGAAVLDRTTGTLTTVGDDKQLAVPLPLAGPGTLPSRTNGAEVPVTVPDSRQVYVVAGSAVRQFGVPGDGAKLRPAVAWAGRFYCADDETGVVHVFDAAGELKERIDVRAGGPLELEVRENYLFINAPQAATARVVDDKHEVRVVDKYANDVLGGDPPPAPPPAPERPRKPTKPVASRPSAPRGVTAAAGNAQARVSWRPAMPNGAAITRYVVEGGGKTHQVGADQRSLEITGLTNGETYRFTVHAVNAKGAGPGRTSNPVVPTAEVPDPPARVTAREKPDGTVVVDWPAANGQGRDIRRYVVTAVAAGASAPIGEVTNTRMVIKAGELAYGNQYAFSVVAVNERGAGSKASPLSNTVVPFTLPGRPESVDAATVGEQRGAIAVSWAPAADNGRPVTKYVLRAGERTIDVTDGTATTVTGLPDGAPVSVSVHAVNEAGDGPAGSATARTVAPPRVTVTGTPTDHVSLTANLTVDAGGGNATCALQVAGAGTAQGPCTRLRVAGLKPSTAYTFTVTATNAAGTSAPVRGNVSTAAVYGRSVCVNNTRSTDPLQAVWCNDPNNGMEVYNGRSEGSTRLGRGGNGSRYQAICKANGDRINDYVYNPGKMGTGENDGTPIWIRIKFGDGEGYMSFAWFNLEGYGINSTGPLPNC